MKAYTVTFLIHNYGSILQAFALQSRLKEMGVEPVLIVKTTGEVKRSLIRSLIKTLKPQKHYSFFKRVSKVLQEKKFNNKVVKLENFIKNHLMVVRIDDLSDFLRKISPEDVFIAGSDQIWNTLNYPLSTWYSLQWLTGSNKKYSYAASIGISCLDESQLKQYENGLADFQMISLREKQAVELLEPLFSAKIRQDLDPTLLYDSFFWRKIESSRLIDEPYVFVYMLRPDRNVINLAKTVAKEKKCKVVYTGLYADKFLGVTTVCDSGIEEFLSFIDNAEAVVTNSFHGTVFSVLFEKPFLSVRIESTSSRVESFLNLIGLESQLVTDFNKKYQVCPLDFSVAKSILANERKKSLDYLELICQS